MITGSGYSLDDILLVPQHSTVPSRLMTDVSTPLTRDFYSGTPVFSTNMSTITEEEMVATLHREGGNGFVHRFLSVDRGVDIIEFLQQRTSIGNIIMSVGVGDAELDRAKAYVDAGASTLLLDVAHGDSQVAHSQLLNLRTQLPDTNVIFGNIATTGAAKKLLYVNGEPRRERWIPHALRVGIGGGSRCTTRTVTGHGVPNLTALVDVADVRNSYMGVTGIYVPIIMDGGIKNSGDIVKALYAGADSVSIGGLFAGTKETPGKPIETERGFFKEYYGMSSAQAQRNGLKRFRDGIAPEGFSERVPLRGTVLDIYKPLIGGIRSGLTYSNARNIKELRENAHAILITNAARAESKL